MKKIVIYTTRYCPFCLRAKSLLDELSLSYDEIAVDDDPVKREEMQERSGRHTVPQIFIGGQSVGGCDDLFALHADGQLMSMI